MVAPRRKPGAVKPVGPVRPRVKVLLPLPLDGAYDYGVPEGMAVPPPGTFVEVPFGGRELRGVVWDGAPDPTLSEGKLKNLLGTLIVPPMTGSLRRFVDWVAAYTMAPPGAVLRMAMSV
ncbi:hypothetical protein RQ832_22040, partial [Roseomonas sp. DSM 102946]|nr:hypothetical protein [Roseomonas sp. DSM 102946]